VRQIDGAQLVFSWPIRNQLKSSSASILDTHALSGPAPGAEGSRDCGPGKEQSSSTLRIGWLEMWRALTSRTVRHLAAATIALPTFVQSASGAPPDPFLAAIAGMKKSIAAVVCVMPHAPNTRFSPFIDGTAFFTSASGEFLTAAHVARDFSAGGSLQNCPMGVWFSQGADAPGHIGFRM